MSLCVKELTDQGIQTLTMNYGHLLMADMVTRNACLGSKSLTLGASKTLSAIMGKYWRGKYSDLTAYALRWTMSVTMGT